METQKIDIRKKLSIDNGDKFKEKDFLGFCFFNGISKNGVSIKKEHVSGEDYYENILSCFPWLPLKHQL